MLIAMLINSFFSNGFQSPLLAMLLALVLSVSMLRHSIQWSSSEPPGPAGLNKLPGAHFP
ncbi:MAG: hypothetical protein R3D25_17575 [Geminicoccaceae bacterium]